MHYDFRSDGKDERACWERHFIKSRNTKAQNGCNLTDGGEGAAEKNRTLPARFAACAVLTAGNKKRLVEIFDKPIEYLLQRDG